MADKRKNVAKIVRCMGLYWKRDAVDWQGTTAKLIGKLKNDQALGLVDFASQVGVYALYADYHLVYIGRANEGENGCLGKRLKAHIGNHLAGRWNMFSWFGMNKVNKKGVGAKFNNAKIKTDALIALIEGLIIEISEPPQNSHKGNLESVEQYLQEPFIDPVQDPVLANKRIADIAKYLRGQDGKHGIKRKKTNKKISLLDAAADIVARSKKPMTCPEIIAELPLKTRNNIKGKTPPRTLNSSIWKEIKTNGLNSRFCAVSGRKFMAY